MQRAIFQLLRCPRCRRGRLMPDQDAAPARLRPPPLSRVPGELPRHRGRGRPGAGAGLLTAWRNAAWSSGSSPAPTSATCAPPCSAPSRPRRWTGTASTCSTAPCSAARGPGAGPGHRHRTLRPAAGARAGAARRGGDGLVPGACSRRPWPSRARRACSVDFLRAEAPYLPFHDARWAGCCWPDSLHFIADAGPAAAGGGAGAAPRRPLRGQHLPAAGQGLRLRPPPRGAPPTRGGGAPRGPVRRGTGELRAGLRLPSSC